MRGGGEVGMCEVWRGRRERRACVRGGGRGEHA